MKTKCGLMGCVVPALFAVVLVIMLLPAINGGHCSRRAACANNLSQLSKLLSILETRGIPPKISERGSDFWLSFRRMNPPLIQERHLDVYFCPVKGEYEKGRTDYRGPAVSFTDLEADAPLGADLEDNHGGEDINVLLKDGSVREVLPDDDLWTSCRRLLRP